MDRITALGVEYGFRVMSDASHALGAAYQGVPHAKRGGDLSVLSFHPVKIVTTGEGGAVLTDSEELFDKVSLLRSHGVSRDDRYQSEFDGPWSYVQVDLGFNYRMTDIQAVLGLSQMDRVEAYVTRRNELAARYARKLAGMPVKPLAVNADCRSAYHLYVVRLDSPIVRKKLFEGLMAEEIFPQVHYIPIHTQPYYRELGFRRGDFPAAEWHYAHSISLPLFPAMTDREQDRVVACVENILVKAEA